VRLLGRVQRADERLLRAAPRARSGILDDRIVRLTRAANYSRLWLLVGGVLLAFGGPCARRAGRRGLSAVAIAAVVANGPAKLLVRRRRPRGEAAALIRMPRSSSFPSGHSAAAVAFATGAGLECPALLPALAPLAAAVAYSRVHAGVHYPSDVAAGVAIGVASGLLAGRPGRRTGSGSAPAAPPHPRACAGPAAAPR
jgi:membrane-associated phospholipid phosphatase